MIAASRRDASLIVLVSCVMDFECDMSLHMFVGERVCDANV